MNADLGRKKILIMAGGTGGHVYPALAVARVLQRNSLDIVWLGTERGLESRVVPAAGIEIEWVNISGLRGKGASTLLLAPFKLVYAVTQSLSVMFRHKPAAVLGMGGFVSGPGGLAAWLMRRPLLIHEQNAVSGMTNRLLARLARVVLQAFPGSFPDAIAAHTVGNPVREEIAAIPEPAVRFRGRTGALRLLVVGGSQGALALNRLLPQALAMLPEDRRPIVRHQAGQRTLQIAQDAYSDSGIEVTVEPFIDDMAEAYGWADLVVCRAGALTVAEIAAAGLPAVFVPFPAAVDDHQTVNAQGLAEAGSALIVQEQGLTAEGLAKVLNEWLGDRDQLMEKAKKARVTARPHALQEISDYCLDIAGMTA